MILFDSIKAANIPKDAQAIAGYVDGRYAWSQLDFDSFPQALIKRHITVGYFAGDTLDVERYDASPSFAGIWCRNRLSAGIINPWVYSDRNDQKACEDFMWNEDISLDQASMWIATLDGTQTVQRYRYPIVAVQFADLGPVDESVYASALGSATNEEEEEMKDFLVRNTSNPTVYWVRGYTLTPLSAIDDLASLNLPLVKMPDNDFASFQASMTNALKSNNVNVAFPTKAETIFS